MKIKAFPVGPIGTNCYLLIDEPSKTAAVIDPGDEPEKIMDMVNKEGVQVKYILMTHGHFDHITGLPGLVERLPNMPTCYIHREDTKLRDPQLYPLSGRVTGYCCYEDGDQLQLGELTIQVLHTPGHSPGSVTLKVNDCLFVGDTLFAGSVGRTDLEGGDYRMLMKSVKRLAQLEGDYHVCPGHMGLTTLDQERRTNPYVKEALGG